VSIFLPLFSFEVLGISAVAFKSAAQRCENRGISKSVVTSLGHIHHRLDLDLIINNDRSLLDGADAEKTHVTHRRAKRSKALLVAKAANIGQNSVAEGVSTETKRRNTDATANTDVSHHSHSRLQDETGDELSHRGALVVSRVFFVLSTLDLLVDFYCKFFES
jgi:hypothetical protein